MCIPFPFQNKQNWKCLLPSTNARHFVYTVMRSAQSYKHYIYARCCPSQVGRRNLIVTRGMLKPVYFAFVETISDFCLFVCSFVCFFCKLHILHLGSRGPSAKYLRWNKQVDIKSSFSWAHRASLTRLRREPSESIRKKMSSGIQGKHFVKLWAHSPRPTSKII